MKPDPMIGRLLTTLDGPDNLLPWMEVERLVASAPAVHVPWYAAVIFYGTRHLRYATAAAALVLLGTGVLAMMPAQSDQVGTLVLTKLPSAWPVGSEAFAEVKDAATAEFDALRLPQSDMYVVVGERAGRDELGFVLLGADAATAREFLSSLTERYPALGAFSAEFNVIDTERFGSRLREVVYSLTHGGRLDEMSDNELKEHVLQALSTSGIRDVENVTVTRRPDGKVVIVIDAALEYVLDEVRTQEELAAAGVNSELLGAQNYGQLLELIAGPRAE